MRVYGLACLKRADVKRPRMVEKPFKLSLRQLMSDFEQLTYPITLVCAGNRRKEQNLVRKSKGFSWGPSGVSTALFTGVTMAEVIKRARPRRKAKYVCMEGADKLVRSQHKMTLRGKLTCHSSQMDFTGPLLNSTGLWIPTVVSCWLMG